MNNNFDIIVIGAGSGGLTTAVGFAKMSKKVLLVEKEKMGGECTNSGCIPSKSLLHLAKEYNKAKQISTDQKSLESFRSKVLENVRAKIDDVLNDEQPDHFEKMGIRIVFGEAEFLSSTSIKVNETVYFFKKAVIATGSSPRLLPVKGLDSKYLLTNQNLFQLKDIPERLLIVGSGPIGLEMGQAFAMLGTKVAIISNEDKLLSRSEDAVGIVLSKNFEKLGIAFLPKSEILEIIGQSAIIKLQDKSENIELGFDYVLQAIGRVPNIPKGLDLANVIYDNNGIRVNHHHETSQKNIFAIGDVSLIDKFTHTADDAARHVIKYVFTFGALSPKRNRSIPKVIYTLPEIAMVGLTLTEIQSRYGTGFVTIELPYSTSDRAKTDDTVEGVLIVYATRCTGQVMGVSIAGVSAGELLHIFSVAIDNKISLWKLHNTIYAYPTYAQLVKKVCDVYFSLVAEKFLSYIKRR